MQVQVCVPLRRHSMHGGFQAVRGNQDPVLGLLHGRKEAVVGQKVKHAIQAGTDAVQVLYTAPVVSVKLRKKGRRPARIALRQLQEQADGTFTSALWEKYLDIFLTSSALKCRLDFLAAFLYNGPRGTVRPPSNKTGRLTHEKTYFSS